VSRPSQNSQLFSGLSAGTYTVVTSGRACTDTQTIDVVEPAVLVVLHQLLYNLVVPQERGNNHHSYRV
jgi:hypothetical protein